MSSNVLRDMLINYVVHHGNPETIETMELISARVIKIIENENNSLQLLQ